MKKEIEYLKKYYNGNMNDALERLEKGEAVQYIVGNVDFYGYILDVNKNVLIPRRETEELVEEVIKRSKKFDNPVVIDVGTGSGAIAIGLSKELNCHIYASDISKKALEVAKKNSIKNSSNVTFFEGDMLKPYIERNLKVDIIVSNPPYIKEDEQIEKIVKDNEPLLALYAKNNGLEYYESILKTRLSNTLPELYSTASQIAKKTIPKIIAGNPLLVIFKSNLLTPEEKNTLEINSYINPSYLSFIKLPSYYELLTICALNNGLTQNTKIDINTGKYYKEPTKEKINSTRYTYNRYELVSVTSSFLYINDEVTGDPFYDIDKIYGILNTDKSRDALSKSFISVLYTRTQILLPNSTPVLPSFVL